MRFSYQLLPEQPLDELLDTIDLLDELGYWACYSADETLDDQIRLFHESVMSAF